VLLGGYFSVTTTHSVSAEGAHGDKKPYGKPVLRVYGTIQALTAAVGMMGNSDLGTSMTAGKT